MMTHDCHDALEGYDKRQILHDGCAECERRGEDVATALLYLDDERLERAWRRAFDLRASRGEDSHLGTVSYAETDLLEALWAVQLIFERRGFPLDGRIPQALRAVS